MRANKRLLAIPAALGTAVLLLAQSSGEEISARPDGALVFSFAGTYRLRGEVQNGFNVRTYGTEKHEAHLLSRLRLEFDVRWKSLLRVHAQLQDARAFGLSFSDEDFSREIFPIAIHSTSTSFISRFAPSASSDSRSIDRRSPTETAGPTVYATYNTIKNLPINLDLFYIFKHDRSGSIKGENSRGKLSSHSAGFRIEGRGSGWDYSAMAVGQLGRWGADVTRAYGLAFSLGYALSISFLRPPKPFLSGVSTTFSVSRRPGTLGVSQVGRGKSM